MDTLRDRVAKLSPAKRAALEQALKQQDFVSHPNQINPRRASSEPAPLSFAQQRLWFLSKFESDSTAYNQPKAIRLKGTLDLTSLKKALNTIVERHEVLRTTFLSEDGETVKQLVTEPQPLDLATLDLTEYSGANLDAELQRRFQKLTEHTFNLSRDLMLRPALVKLGSTEYILFLLTHHIASDGWSNGILWQELAALYDAFARGQQTPLPELRIQYADYAVWQRHWLRGEVLADQISYWKRQLSGVSVLELPTDRPRPRIRSYRGTKQTFVFSKALSDQLQSLSRKEGVTLFMTLLATFQVLLHRYTGQDDIAVGSPIAGRTCPETERLIGFFVNTLVLRTDLSNVPTFRELLARVRRVVFDTLDHQDVPFEKLVEELHPDRDLSRGPLFQVMFTHQNTRQQIRELPGLSVSPVEIKSDTAKFDLSLYTWDEVDGLTAELEYNTDLFDAATITRMLGHFETLVRGIVTNPDQRISDLSILTEAEKTQLLVEWNDTKRYYPKDKCVHELIEQQVEQSPDAVAVVFEGKQLTYRELNRRANQLAHYLKHSRVEPEELVGLYMERSLDTVVGLLGILKAGGAYVPLNPNLSKERLDFMLEDTQIKVLLTHKSLVEGLSAFRGRVMCLDEHWVEIARESERAPVARATPEGLAYVIYTSGSTGRPKGVQIPHRALVNFLTSMREQPGLMSEDALLAVTPLSFDIAGLELFLPLIAGARIVMIGSDVAVNGDRLSEELAKSRASVMQATPATWQLLLEAGWQKDHHLKILCGGEALPRELAAQLLSQNSSLWNLYGPTETTIWSTLYRVGLGNGPVLLGRPIANTYIYILDRQLKPVPIGVHGELYIGGAGLARGYLNRPELNAEKFIPDLFSNELGARLYKTGDVARYLPSGNIEFLGRNDNQVKIRGFRIELEEIETLLRQHPIVKEAVVITHQKDSSDDKQLVAYIVAKLERFAPLADLRGFLKKTLPNYAVPSAFVFLDSLPLTPNGKLDRKALPPPDECCLELDKTFVAPRTPDEELMAHIWTEILKVDRLGIYDNFFDLGGHSLLATRVMSRVGKEFNIDLPLRILFEAPTVAGMAAVVLQTRCETTERQDLSDLLSEVESLTNDDAQRLLFEEIETMNEKT